MRSVNNLTTIFAVLLLVAALMVQSVTMAESVRGAAAEYIMEEVEEAHYGEIAAQMKQELRELSSSDSREGDVCYYGGYLNKISANTVSSLLSKKNLVGFIKRYRSKNRLILTRKCWIRNSSIAGGYYCVDHKTVCVAARSMSRFYGEHTSGGPCGMFPLSDDNIDGLQDDLRTAYYNTCDGDDCDGR